MTNLVVGLWSGHDCAYCVMDSEGRPVIHAELERYNREKNTPGDAFELMLKRSPDLVGNIKYFAVP